MSAGGARLARVAGACGGPCLQLLHAQLCKVGRRCAVGRRLLCSGDVHPRARHQRSAEQQRTPARHGDGGRAQCPLPRQHGRRASGPSHCAALRAPRSISLLHAAARRDSHRALWRIRPQAAACARGWAAAARSRHPTPSTLPRRKTARRRRCDCKCVARRAAWRGGGTRSQLVTKALSATPRIAARARSQAKISTDGRHRFAPSPRTLCGDGMLRQLLRAALTSRACPARAATATPFCCATTAPASAAWPHATSPTQARHALVRRHGAMLTH